MKINKIREMSSPDLKKELGELKGEEPVVAEEPKKAEKKTASKAKKEATEGTEKKARKTTTKKESKAE